MSSRQAMFKVYIGPPEGGVQVDIEGCGAWERGLNWSAQKWRGSREVLLTTVRNGRGCSVWGAQNGEGGVSRGGGAQPQDSLVPKPGAEPTQGQSLRGVWVKVG